MCQIRAFTKNTRIQNIVFENISLTQRKTFICISCNSPGYIKYNLVLSIGLICGPQQGSSKQNYSIAYLFEVQFKISLTNRNMKGFFYQAWYNPFYNIRQDTQLYVYLIKEYGTVPIAYGCTEVIAKMTQLKP